MGSTIDASGPVPQSSAWSLAIHGGAGAAPRDLTESDLALTRHAMAAALEAGAAILAGGGGSVDAVQAAVRSLENCGVLNAGRGAVLNHEGFAELDACVMDGNGRRVGAVAGLRHIANPIDLARRIMEHGRHVMLAGAGAEQFATEQGVTLMPASYFVTERRRRQLAAALVAAGTVGAVARDTRGNLAAATSTGGLTNKHSGRVGDSPIVGAGTFAENGVCAVSATGDGEFFIRFTVASEVSARIRYQGRDVVTAAREVIDHLSGVGGTGGLIAIDAAGRIAMPYSTAVMPGATSAPASRRWFWAYDRGDGRMINIGLIGDYDPGIVAHQAIPEALRLAAQESGIAVGFEWVATDRITDARQISYFDGLWCVPGSPYRSLDGALLAIRSARESQRPFLGTCGGFQHAVIEYARHVLGWSDAEHAETAPAAARPVIALLECALVEATETLQPLPDTLIRAAYGRDEIVEGYRCRYGLNPAFRRELTSGNLRIAARSQSGEVRALELTGQRFFVLTLFQPERAALKGVLPPLVRAFVASARQQSPPGGRPKGYGTLQVGN